MLQRNFRKIGTPQLAPLFAATTTLKRGFHDHFAILLPGVVYSRSTLGC